MRALPDEISEQGVGNTIVRPDDGDIRSIPVTGRRQAANGSPTNTVASCVASSK